MPLIDFIAATLAVIAGSVVQVASGVGGGFIIVPLLALIDVGLIPAPLIFASLSLSTLMAWREWHAVDHTNTGYIFTGLTLGSVLGGWLLASIPGDRLGLVFGSVILLAIVVTLLGRRIPLNGATGTVTGIVSGAMGTSSGIGAPPLALLYQDQSGAKIRATLAVLYTGASLIILVILFGYGKFGLNEARDGLLLVPGFVLGYWLANRWTPHVDQGHARVAVLTVSAAAAIFLIIRNL